MWDLVENLLRAVYEYDFAHADMTTKGKKKSADPRASFLTACFYDPRDSVRRLLDKVQYAVDDVVVYANTYQWVPDKNKVLDSIVSRVVIANLDDKENAAYDVARILARAANAHQKERYRFKDKSRFFFNEKNEIPAYVPEMA